MQLHFLQIKKIKEAPLLQSKITQALSKQYTYVLTFLPKKTFQNFQTVLSSDICLRQTAVLDFNMHKIQNRLGGEGYLHAHYYIYILIIGRTFPAPLNSLRFVHT